MIDHLITEIKALMKVGVYDPEALFSVLYNQRRWHYAPIRHAIHLAKTR